MHSRRVPSTAITDGHVISITGGKQESITRSNKAQSMRNKIRTISDRVMMSSHSNSSGRVIYTLFTITFLNLLVLSFVTGQSTVTGVVGGKVSLPCNVTPPTNDDQVSLVLWYKEESTTPIYSLDARKGTLDQARHASADSITARSYFSTVAKSAHLIIEGLIEEDAGIYRCRADFRKARTRNFAINLEIITPPEKPIIRDGSSDEILSTLIGPFNEGDRLLLVCETFGGKPKPELKWLRENVVLDDTYEYISGSSRPSGRVPAPEFVVRNELEIKSLARHDLMALLTCSASNNNISASLTQSVTVDMNFRPLLVEISPDQRNHPVSADKSVELVCKGSGSRPPAQMSWWKGSKQLKRSKESISVDGNVTTSILTFTPTSDDSGKFISCRAENPLIPGSAIEDGFKLEVHYIPQLSLRLGSKLRHSHIQEGNDVYFECNIRAAPWVTEVRWWFEGKEVTTNTSAGVIVSNQSLVLQRVSKSSRGRYTCSAANTEGEGESNSVHLRVQYSPRCKTNQKMIYGAAKFEQVKIHCEVDSDPPEATFSTTSGTGSEGSNTKVINHSPGPISDVGLMPPSDSLDGDSKPNQVIQPSVVSSIATYSPESESDYGTLYCYARNSVGSQVDPCVFTIIPAGPPDPMKNCTILNTTEEMIKVECSEGYDGGLLQYFVAEVRDASIQKLYANVTSTWPSFAVKGLDSGTSYLVVLYAANSKGRSKPVVLTSTTKSLPESLNRLANGNVWQLNFSPILALLIAIVVILVIISFVILIIVKVRSSSSSSSSSSTSSHSNQLVNNRNRKGSKTANGSNGTNGLSAAMVISDSSKSGGEEGQILTRKASCEDVCDACTCSGSGSGSDNQCSINTDNNHHSHHDKLCPDIIPDPNELGLDLSEDNLLNHHYQSNYGLSMDPHHQQQHLYGGGGVDKYGPPHSNSHVMISDTSSVINNSTFNNITGHNIYGPNILSSNNGQSGPSVQYIHHLQAGHQGGHGLLLQTVVPSSIGSHSPSSSSPASSIHYHQAPTSGQVMMMHSLYHQPGTLSSSPSNHGHNLSAGCPLPPVSNPQFSTLQMPRRVRVIPTGSNNILTTTVDDIIIAGGHQRTDV